MIKFNINEKIFKTNTLFIFNCEGKEFIKTANKYGIGLESLDEHTNGMVVKAGNNFYRVMWIEKFENTSVGISVLIHELFHLVIRICNDKGVSIKANIETGECGDETAAYLLEFYTEETLKKLRK